MWCLLYTHIQVLNKQSVIKATLLFDNNEHITKKKREPDETKDQANKTSSLPKYGFYIKHIRGNPEVQRKNFALWKEIMQDVLIIRCQIEEPQWQ